MTRAIAILAACAAVAWLVRSRKSTPEPMEDPMDGVQDDPWTARLHAGEWVIPAPQAPIRVDHVGPFGSSSVSIPPGTQWTYTTRALPDNDTTYLEATALAAIRRSAQSADVTTEGMS